MSASAMIELNDVSRWYGEVIGVNRVTATLRPGITGLLGPNGAGKSTLMNLLTGMIHPSQGTVLMYGEPVWGNAAMMHRLGYCAQTDSFYEKFSARDFIESLLLLRGWMKSRARAAAIHSLEQLGMAQYMNRRIQSYSKGMRQRVKVALALAHNPEILVLDEPLNGLDAVGRHEMMGLIRQFGKEGRNVIISSHVLHEIGAMTNNILMMSGGYLLAEGDIREVRQGLKSHPHQILIRCTNPRQAAVFFLEQESTLSARVEELDHAVIVETRDVDRFYDQLNTLVLDRGLGISYVSVADENISSIFGYLSASGGKSE
ncbi:ABC transporter ATP-binding protein [bacterium]|nr:ABC transporter ATP-binding protein [bacterium]